MNEKNRFVSNVVLAGALTSFLTPQAQAENIFERAARVAKETLERKLREGERKKQEARREQRLAKIRDAIAQLRPGDVILTWDESVESNAIRKATSSAVSHAMVAVGAGRVVEAIPEGVVSNDAIVALEPKSGFKIVRPRLDEAKRQQFVSWVLSNVGKGYDYRGAVHEGWLGLGRSGDNAYFCSELAIVGLDQVGVKVIPELKVPPLPNLPPPTVELPSPSARLPIPRPKHPGTIDRAAKRGVLDTVVHVKLGPK